MSRHDENDCKRASAAAAAAGLKQVADIDHNRIKTDPADHDRLVRCTCRIRLRGAGLGQLTTPWCQCETQSQNINAGNHRAA